jgi:hypothetical protein
VGLYGFVGPAELILEGDAFTMRPRKPWEFWMPTVEGRWADIEMVWKLKRGIEIEAPGKPSLNGLRFRPLARRAELLEAIAEIGIRVEPSRRRDEGRGSVRADLVAHRPGWIWRDRRLLAFVEVGVGPGSGAGLLIAFLLFVDAAPGVRMFMIVTFAVVELVGMLSAIGSYFEHRRLTRSSRPDQPSEARRRIATIDGPGRAKRGASGSLNPQSAPAGPNPVPRGLLFEVGLAHASIDGQVPRIGSL